VYSINRSRASKKQLHFVTFLIILYSYVEQQVWSRSCQSRSRIALRLQNDTASFGSGTATLLSTVVRRTEKNKLFDLWSDAVSAPPKRCDSGSATMLNFSSDTMRKLNYLSLKVIVSRDFGTLFYFIG
jgi:hypothetical protein